MAKLQVTVGLPGCGKSTYAKQRALDGAFVVDIDAIITMLHGGNYNLYERDFDPVYKMIEIDMVKTALLAGRDVILDKCCNKASTRRRFAEIGNQLQVRTEVVVFDNCSIDQLVARRMTNSRGHSADYWRKVIQKRIELMEPVNYQEEGFDSISHPIMTG